MDQDTAHRSVLTRARVCVEVDASKDLPTTLFVEVGGVLHSVDVVYDEFPKYCGFCSKHGHDTLSCFKKNPSLRLKGQNVEEHPATATLGPQPSDSQANEKDKDNEGFQQVKKQSKKVKSSFNVFGKRIKN